MLSKQVLPDLIAIKQLAGMSLALACLQPMMASAATTRATLPSGTLSQPVVAQGVAPVSDATLSQLMDEAERLYQQKNDAEALKLFSSLIELAPQHRMQAWLRVGNIHQRAGAPGSALEAYQHLLSGDVSAAQRRLSPREKAANAARRVQEDAYRLKGMVNLTMLAIDQARVSLDEIEVLQRDPAVRQTAGLDDATEAALVQTLRSQAAQIQRLLGASDSAYGSSPSKAYRMSPSGVYSMNSSMANGVNPSLPQDRQGLVKPGHGGGSRSVMSVRRSAAKPDILVGHGLVPQGSSPVPQGSRPVSQGNSLVPQGHSPVPQVDAASSSSPPGLSDKPGSTPHEKPVDRQAAKPARSNRSLPVIEYQVAPVGGDA